MPPRPRHTAPQRHVVGGQPSYAELLERIEALEQRSIGVADLPMGPLQNTLETNWQPNADILLGAQSIGETLLSSDVISRFTALEGRSTANATAQRSSQSIPNAAWTIFGLNAISVTLGNGLSLVTTAGIEHVLIDRDGLYIVDATVVYSAGGGVAVGDRLMMSTATTGTPTAGTNAWAQQRTGAHANAALLSSSRTGFMVAGTKISVQAWQSSTAAMLCTGTLDVTRLTP